jgi:uncharacterized protein
MTQSTPNGITVRGSGQVARTPDLARVTVGVEAAAATAGEAQAAASARIRAVLAALREAGVEDRDVASARISLEPAYDYSGPAPRMTGYGAHQSLAVRVRQLDELGAIIDRAIAAGATVVHDVTLDVAEPAVALAEARDLAMADARTKAGALARAAGVTLGKAVSIVEAPSGNLPLPMFKARLAAAPPSDTPIAAGTTELAAEVEVTFAILG